MSCKVIMLVEDNQDDEELAMLAFKRSRVLNEVLVARDGVEALDYLIGPNSLEVLPQVVLLDLKLPKMDGLEVLRRLRADPRTKRLPIVVLTSSSEEEDMIISYDLGANSFVRKPVDFSQFTEAVLQLQMYWLVLNHAPAKTT
jgi:two-component system response regulator